jgi:hypothetical protein
LNNDYKEGEVVQMQHICGWCGKFLGEDDEEPKGMVSHGMCNKCHQLVLHGLWEPNTNGEGDNEEKENKR